MKKYYIYATVFTVLIFAACGTSGDDSRKLTHFVSNQLGSSGTISIPDFKDSLKIMQITDAHISIDDENESDLIKYGERMHKGYAAHRSFFLTSVAPRRR